MEVVKITLGPYNAHCYLVKEGDFCALIDAEENHGEITAELNRRGWVISDLLLTHVHFDHVRGVPEFVGKARICIHGADAPYLPGRNQGMGEPFEKDMEIAGPFHLLRDGDTIGPLRVMHVPGHSPGSVLFIAPGHIFSGDSLFVRGVPMLEFPLGDRETYLRSLERMRELPGDAILHAGHGGEGLLREALPQW